MVAVVGLVAAYGVADPSWASAASLSGSNFEIDTDANLTVDAASPAIDWLNSAGTAMRPGVLVRDDLPTGTTDDSFTQGTNINNPPGATVTLGGIPNNKSDLTHFGIYKEEGGSDPFINVFWTRVQAPSGTTTMDFEFNQSSSRSNGWSSKHPPYYPNQVIPVRSVGDILISYLLDNGGTNPHLTKRIWNGSAWGTETAFSPTDGLAAINTSAITAGNSDGLGALDPLTFGEASVRLSAFASGEDTCRTFGSVYLRSRSSDTDTDENKDFIAPEPITISNCGSVTIHKTDDNGALAGAEFTLYHNVAPLAPPHGVGDTATTLTCTTDGNGDCTIPNVPKGEYLAVETVTPDGHDSAPDQQVSITAGDQVVPLTFNDPIQHGHIIVIKDAVPNDPQDFTFTLDGANGVTLDDDPASPTSNQHDYTVVVGSHSLLETSIPSGWVNTGLVCVDPTSNSSVNLATSTATVNVAKNETVTCTYTDTYTPTAPKVDTTAAVAVANTSWNDTATVTGDGTHAVAGNVSFYVCGPTDAPADCASTANKVGSDVDVVNGSATTSEAYTPPSAGNYCFRAEFHSTSPYYTDANHTNSTTECFLKRNANLTVSKTATAAFGRAYTWSVDKSVVGDSSVSVPAGQTHSFDYQVSVSHTSSDSSWTVTGVITVANSNGVAFSGVDVTDAINNGAGDCQVQNGSNITVPAHGNVQLGYTCTYGSAPDPAQGLNTATATWDGDGYFTTASSATGTASVDFSKVSPSTTNEFVTVSDTLQGTLGTLDGATAENPTVYTYSIEQTAPQGTCTTVPNTATVTTVAPQGEGVQGALESTTLDSASASVTICGGVPLTVGQAAGGTYDREYLWLINKDVDSTRITNSNGQTGTFTYTVTVTPNGTADSGYALSGTVTVTNPNDFEDIVADVTVTSDLGGGVLCSVVDGAGAVIPKSGGTTFAYTCSFTGPPVLTGSMTANVTWDGTAAATTDSSASNTLPVSLTLANETNRTITVTDDKTDPANPVQLGTATYDDGAKTFTYSLTKDGVPGTAAGPGCVTYTNVATIVETEQSDTQDATLCHTFTGGGGKPVVNPPQGGGLPFTGDGIGLMARESIGLILAGGLLLFLSRKKRLA